ncbi:MAG: hypothetical protein JJU11_16330 [Candidatus Sumerlaeia bacterium]|nr:hypothetical protein [Candidatus Sumerlaeia bacterium]
MIISRELLTAGGVLALGASAFATPFEWESVELPLGAAAPISTVYQDRLLILGGERAGEPSDVIWSSDDARHWNRHPSALPIPIRTGSAVEFGGVLLLFPTGDEDMPVLASTTGLDWETVTVNPPLNKADWRQATIHGDQIWLLSGGEGEPVEARRSFDGENWEIVATEGLGSIDHGFSLESYDGRLILFHPEFAGYPGLGPSVDRVITSESVDGLEWTSTVQELFIEYDSSSNDLRPYHRTFDLMTTVWNGKLWMMERGAVHVHPSLADTMILLSTSNVRDWARRRPTSDGNSNQTNRTMRALLHPFGEGLVAGSTHGSAANSLRKWTHDPDSGSVLGQWETTFEDLRLADVQAASFFHHANRLWVAGTNGLLSTADNVVWTRHANSPNLSNSRFALHGDDVYISLPNGATYRLETSGPQVNLSQVQGGLSNTSIAAHDGWLYRLDEENIESETVICGWNFVGSYIPIMGQLITTVSANRVLRSRNGFDWEVRPGNTFSARGSVYTSFDGSLWGFGGTRMDQRVGSGNCPLSGYTNNQFRRQIRRMTESGSWVQVGDLPESVIRVINSIHIHGNTVYMIADDRKLFSSTNMVDWTLVSENYTGSIAQGQVSTIAVGPNQAWMIQYQPSNANSTPRLLGTKSLGNQAEFNFPGSSPQWNFRSHFDTVDAFAHGDEGRLLLTVPRVDDEGHAFLEGPLIHPVSPDDTLRPGSGYPVPVAQRQSDGDLFLRMEVVGQAVEGQPWFRLRGNSQGYRRASEVKITTLGGDRPVLGNGMGTYTAILNYQPGDDHLMPFIDLLTNKENSSVGTLGVESIRITEWTPSADENLELVREYTFPWETRGFTPREIDVLIPPVAMYHDGRGLVIRGADTPRADDVVFGFWGHESDVTIAGGAVYKFTWQVGSDTPADRPDEMPIVRLRVNETSFRVAPILTVVSRNHTRLPLDGNTEEYVLWFEAPEQLDGDQFIFSFDLLWTTNEVTRRLDREVWLESLRVEVVQHQE